MAVPPGAGIRRALSLKPFSPALPTRPSVGWVPEPDRAWAEAGTALVGTHEEAAERILEYHRLGFDEFVLSGYPTVSLLETARALGAKRGQVIRDVVLPAALPETFTGIRLAVGIAYSAVVAAELFNGIPGIGGMVKDASNYNNTPVVLVGIFAIGLSGLVIDALLRVAEQRLVPWRGRA